MAHFSAVSFATVVVVVLVVSAAVDAAPARERRDVQEAIKWNEAIGRTLCGVNVESYKLPGSSPTRSVQKVSCLSKDEGRHITIGKHVYMCVAVQTTHSFADGSPDGTTADVDSGCIALRISDQEVNATSPGVDA